MLWLAMANPDEARGRVVLLVGALIALCLIAGAAILIVRRKMFATDHAAADQGSLLDQLRGMRDRGEISPAEFDQAKAAMHAKMRASIADGLPRPGLGRATQNPGKGKASPNVGSAAGRGGGSVGDPRA
jgi:hypothetical protein